MKTVICSVLMILLACTGTALADWKWIGPSAGSIEELRPDRSDNDLWFAVNNGSLYRSTDAGRSWSATGIKKVGYQGSGYTGGTSVTITPQGRVIVLRHGGNSTTTEIWTSDNHGKSFQHLSTTAFVLTRTIPHPNIPELIYGTALTGWGIVVSRDGGKRWSALMNLPLPRQQHPGCSTPDAEGVDLALSPFQPDVLYISGTLVFLCGPESDEELFFLKTTTAGQSWSPVHGIEFATFHQDPIYPDRLFATNRQQLFQLTRNGWQQISSQPIQELFSVPRHLNELLAFSAGYPVHALRSTDTGITWKNLNLDLQGKVRTLATLDDPYRGLLGGTEGGGLYFKDERQKWTAASTGFRESEIADVQGSSSFLFALEQKDFLFAKNEAGSWRNLTFGIPGGSPFGMGVNAVDPRHIIVASNGIHVSRDGGSTWSQATLNAPRAGAGRVIVIDPYRPRIVYAPKGNSYGLFKSNDGGNTFRSLSPAFPSKGYQDISRIIPDPNNSAIVYFVVPYFGIFKSTNGGATVAAAINGIGPPCPDCQSNPAIDMIPLAAAGSYLAITTQGKMYRTNDAARQWQLIGQGPAMQWVSRIFAADGMGHHLYCIAGQEPKLYESLDGGKNWTNITTRLKGATKVYSLTNPQQLPVFAATDHGVYQLLL